MSENVYFKSTKDVSFFFEHKRVSFKNYKFNLNNWRDSFYSNEILDELCELGFALWLNEKGEIHYRYELNGKVYKSSISNNFNVILSKILQGNIKLVNRYDGKQLFRSNIKEYKNTKNNEISTQELIIVETEAFSPSQKEEFFQRRNNSLVFIKNTFIPTNYFLEKNPYKDTFESIILQYIFYLSDYNQNKFKYIMDWLAYSIQKIESFSKIPLVFLCEENSETNLLFTNIIQRLYSYKYSRRNTISESIDLKYSKEVLFANVVISKNNTFSKDCKLLKNSYSTPFLVIESYDKYIPFLSEFDNYIVIKAPDDYNNIHIPEWAKKEDFFKNKRDSFREDLYNFLNILQSRTIDSNFLNKKFDDDRSLMIEEQESSFEIFYIALLEKNIDFFREIEYQNKDVFDRIKENFQDKKIMQSDIHKSYKILFPNENISSKALMAKLREFDVITFSIENIINGSSGKKYIPLKNTNS